MLLLLHYHLNLCMLQQYIVFVTKLIFATIQYGSAMPAADNYNKPQTLQSECDMYAAANHFANNVIWISMHATTAAAQDVYFTLTLCVRRM